MTKTLWKNGTFYADKWDQAADESAFSSDLIISLEEWNTKDWSGHNGKLGLNVHPLDDLFEVEKILHNFDLVVVNFPNFANGTAFSTARMIRDRFGFEGEIRARGAYILDQMPMLIRCGVDTFEISSEAVRAGLNRGAWPDLPRYYQFALDGEGNLARIKRGLDPKRPWIGESIALDEEPSRKVA